MHNLSNGSISSEWPALARFQGHGVIIDAMDGMDVRCAPGSILSVESNQNVESKTKNVESKTKKCGVQNSIFASRNPLFWALTHLIQYNLHSSSFQI